MDKSKNKLSRRIGKLERLEDRIMLSATSVSTATEILHPAFETAGFNLIYSGDTDDDGSMAVQYRTTGSSSWQAGHEGVKVVSYPRIGGVAVKRLEYAGRLFGLTEGTDYDVRVTFSDPDGIVGQAVRTFTMSTRDPVVSNGSGTTYYVNPNAGSGGDGSSGNPFDEIADTTSVVSAGDTIQLLNGVHEVTSAVYFLANGTASNPIRITAAPGASPVVRGKLTGLEGPGTSWRNDNSSYAGVYSTPIADDVHQLYYDGEYLGESDSLANLVNGQYHRSSLRDIDLDGAWYQTGGRLYVKIPQTWGSWSGPVKNPSAIGVEPVVTNEGIIIQGSHWTVDGLTFEYFKDSLIARYRDSTRTADNFTVRDSTFRNFKRGLLLAQSTSNLDDSGLNNALIENNVFTGTPNYVARNWVLGHDIYAVDAITANALNGANGVIRNNTISNMENGIYVGLWGQTPFSNPALTAGWVVRDNNLSFLGDDAIEVEGAGYQNVVIGNDIRNVLTGISMAPASVGPVWTIRNTIYQTDLKNPLGQPISNSLNSPFKFNSAPSPTGPAGPGTLLLSYNNSVYVNDTTGTAAASSRIQVPTAGVNWTSRNDSFVLADGNGYAFWQLAQSPGQHGTSPEDVFVFDFQNSNFWSPTDRPLAKMENTVYQTLADWQAAGFNANGISTLAPYADPANGNFNIPSGSSLHDAGVHIPGITDNYAQGNAPDIGAREASGTSNTHHLTVNSGSGDGNYTSGSVINISAQVPSGSSFNGWTGNTQYIANVNAANTTLTMPNIPVTVTATFDTSSVTYSLNVQNGNGDGSYSAGSVINISAQVPSGQVFDVWTGNTQYIANINSANTTLTMPGNAVTVGATFQTQTGGTVFEVAKSGSPYSTIQSAVNAAFAATSGSPVVRIVDSGVYNEYVTDPNNGTAGVNITIESATGQSPTLYGIEMRDVISNVTIQNLTFDGSLRNYADSSTGRKPEMIFLRGSDNVTFQNNTIKGRGQYVTSTLYGDSSSVITLTGNTFESDTIATTVDDTSGNVGSITIEDNIFEGTKGIDLSKARGAAAGTVTINNNLFNQNSTYGFYFRGSGSELPGTTTIESNTFYKVGGNSLWEGGAIFIRETGDTVPNVSIRDNLIYGQGASSTNYDGFNSSDTTPFSNLNADNNGFYDMRVVSGGAKVASLGRTNWTSIAQLNALSQASSNVVGTSNPFVNAAAGNFNIVAGSWAATAASDGGFIGAYSAPIATQYSLDVQNGTGDGNYTPSTVVNISASIPSGQVFDGWTGHTQYIADINSANTTVTIPNADVTVTATFDTASTQFALNVLNGTGDGNYAPGTSVNISATIPSGQVFSGWTGHVWYLADPNAANTSLTIPNGDVTVTATFDTVSTTYALNVQNGTGDGNYAPGTFVNISATIPSGQVFNGWTGHTQYLADPNSANTSLTIPNGDVTVTATFDTATTQYALNVQNGTGDGNYTPSTVVNISATVPSGQVFSGWTGHTQYIADINSANTTVTIPNGDVTVGATFQTSTQGSIVQEDGNSASDWTVYDQSPSGFSDPVSVVDPVDSNNNVIKLEGNAGDNGYRLIFANEDTENTSIKWRMKYSEGYTLYISAQTTDTSIKNGHRYIYYTASNSDNLVSSTGTGEYIHHGLGSGSIDGQWHTFERDLLADLQEAQPGNNIVSVEAFLIRGSGLIDDITTLEELTPVPVDLNVVQEDGNNASDWTVYDQSPAGFSDPVSVVDNGDNVIKLEGNATENGYRLIFDTEDTENTSIKWRMKYSEYYVIYISAQTTDTSIANGHRYIYYTASNSDNLVSATGTGEYIHHGLGDGSKDGQWHTFERDLLADLQEAQPGNNIVSVEAFLIRGSGLIDDIATLTQGSAPLSSAPLLVAGTADFNQDNDVDGSDFLAWQRGVSTPAFSARVSDGDADNDQDVDSDDLAAWQTAYGQTGSLSSPVTLAPTIATTVVATDPSASIAITSVPIAVQSTVQQQPVLTDGLADAAMALLQTTFPTRVADQLVIEESTLLQDHADSGFEAAFSQSVPTSDGRSSEISDADEASTEQNADEAWPATVDQIWSSL